MAEIESEIITSLEDGRIQRINVRVVEGGFHDIYRISRMRTNGFVGERVGCGGVVIAQDEFEDVAVTRKSWPTIRAQIDRMFEEAG